MKKEKNTTYATYGFVTTAPKGTDKNAPRSSVTKSGKDLRGGKK